MEIGSPLPDTSHLTPEAIGLMRPAQLQKEIEVLHPAHALYDEEIAALHEKKVAVKAVLTQLYFAKSMRTRADFDTFLLMGVKKFTLAKATEYLKDAAEGLVNLPEAAITRLKNIINSGKDEE